MPGYLRKHKGFGKIRVVRRFGILDPVSLTGAMVWELTVVKAESFSALALVSEHRKNGFGRSVRRSKTILPYSLLIPLGWHMINVLYCPCEKMPIAPYSGEQTLPTPPHTQVLPHATDTQNQFSSTNSAAGREKRTHEWPRVCAMNSLVHTTATELFCATISANSIMAARATSARKLNTTHDSRQS